MENASKALLMAGGVLLAILVISLFLFSWGSVSNYYSKQEELVNVENVAEFNLQFSNYDRDDLHGYELVSLANKVADYNKRYSSAEENVSNDGYSPVTIVIKLVSGDVTMENVKNLFSYDNDELRVFTKPSYTQNATSNQIASIITENTGIETLLGGTKEAGKVAKNISRLVKEDVKLSIENDDNFKNLKEDEKNAYIENYILDEYNAITGKNAREYTEVEDYFKDNGEKIKAYYEYYQFKKAIFKCTKLDYDNVTGRVSYMEFEFTGKVD